MVARDAGKKRFTLISHSPVSLRKAKQIRETINDYECVKIFTEHHCHQALRMLNEQQYGGGDYGSASLSPRRTYSPKGD